MSALLPNAITAWFESFSTWTELAVVTNIFNLSPGCISTNCGSLPPTSINNSPAGFAWLIIEGSPVKIIPLLSDSTSKVVAPGAILYFGFQYIGVLTDFSTMKNWPAVVPTSVGYGGKVIKVLAASKAKNVLTVAGFWGVEILCNILNLTPAVNPNVFVGPSNCANTDPVSKVLYAL